MELINILLSRNFDHHFTKLDSTVPISEPIPRPMTRGCDRSTPGGEKNFLKCDLLSTAASFSHHIDDATNSHTPCGVQLCKVYVSKNPLALISVSSFRFRNYNGFRATGRLKNDIFFICFTRKSSRGQIGHNRKRCEKLSIKIYCNLFNGE